MSTRPLALVTGASAGIGKELARVFAADHDLVLTSRRTEELNALAAELRQSHGATCHVVPADLADSSGPRQLFEAVSAAGLGVDVLVNNAGFGHVGPFAGADPDRMLKMIQVNVVALTELTGLFLPGMRSRGRGKILNVGRRLPARPVHGRVLRDEGVRELVLRSAIERTLGHGHHGHMPGTRTHDERVRGHLRNGCD